jgi:glucose-1-phosphatase
MSNAVSVNRTIEFVYFDLGNVLLSFDPQRACRNLAALVGCTTEQAHHAVYGSGSEDRFERGEVSPERFVELVCEELGMAKKACSPPDVLDAISDMFVPIESMNGVLQATRDSGRKVGLLSNTCHAHLDWVLRQKYAVLDFDFHAVITSFEVGAMKPDAAIYQAAEEACAVPAERILFLDDKPENTAAARQRGWQAVTCFGGNEAIEVLRSFGLL